MVTLRSKSSISASVGEEIPYRLGCVGGLAQAVTFGAASCDVCRWFLSRNDNPTTMDPNTIEYAPMTQTNASAPAPGATSTIRPKITDRAPAKINHHSLSISLRN